MCSKVDLLWILENYNDKQELFHSIDKNVTVKTKYYCILED